MKVTRFLAYGWCCVLWAGCSQSATSPPVKTAEPATLPASAVANVPEAEKPAQPMPAQENAPQPENQQVPEKTAPSNAQPAVKTPPATETSKPASEATSNPPAKAPAAAKKTTPATLAVAAKVIDFRTWEVPPEATIAHRSLASLGYQYAGKVSAAYQQMKAKLLAEKWQELPHSYQSEEYCSGMFSRDDFKLSLSALPAGPDMAQISLANLGNVDTLSVPVPPGAKVFSAGPANTLYVTDATVAETTQAMQKLLYTHDWVYYGKIGEDVYDFKQNAVRVSVRVVDAPADAGKTMIDISSTLLSADIPLPPTAIGVQYSDRPTQLAFDLADPQADDFLANFYRTELAKKNWKPTTENLVKIDWKQFLIFRSAEQEMLELQITHPEEVTRVMVRYKTAAEVAEEEGRFQAEMKRRKEEANRPKPSFAFKLPEQAEKIEAKENRIEFQVPAGQGKNVLNELRTQCLKANWMEENSTLQANFGSVTLKLKTATLEINYVETGILPTDISIRSLDMQLQVAGPEPSGK
jgi:hypothetical protein